MFKTLRKNYITKTEYISIYRNIYWYLKIFLQQKNLKIIALKTKEIIGFQ